MKVIYDSQTDTMNVVFREERIKESDEVREGVKVDFSYDGNIVGFEMELVKLYLYSCIRKGA